MARTMVPSGVNSMTGIVRSIAAMTRALFDEFVGEDFVAMTVSGQMLVGALFTVLWDAVTKSLFRS